MRIPSELLDYKQWVLWRRAEIDGRTAKVPISPWSGKPASCDKPQTWGTYRRIRYALQRYTSDGIGFVFTDADPFCGIDLDRCRTAAGKLTSEAEELIKRFHSYAELSPSGTGVHILIRAKLPSRGRRANGIEMYDSGRYFTITGWHVTGTPLAIYDRQNIALTILSELSSSRESSLVAPIVRCDCSDEELLMRANSAKNGDRFSRLWAGDASDYGCDHSRADAALCCLLAFWTGGDAQRMDRLFRHSGLMRKKWDRQTGVTTYGNLTIAAALKCLWLRIYPRPSYSEASLDRGDAHSLPQN